MVFEIQLFLIHALQKVVVPCFRELDPHKSKQSEYHPVEKRKRKDEEEENREWAVGVTERNRREGRGNRSKEREKECNQVKR